MNLEQRFAVAQPADAVWAAFHDPQLLADCLPGASLDGPPREDGSLPLRFKVKLGPIAAAFAGTGRLDLDEAGHAGAFAGQATDGKSNSRVKGEARFRLEAQDAGTAVAVAVDFAITGSLAQFSREGIVRALAEQLTRQFAENLQQRLAQPAAAGLDVPAADAADTADTAATLAAGAAGLGVPPPPACPGDLPGRPAAPAGAARSAEAPALNLLTLLGALLRQTWRRLIGKEAR